MAKGNKSKGSKNKQQRRLANGPGDAAQSYSGPVRIPRGIEQVSKTVTELTVVVNLTSTGGSAFAGVIPMNLSNFSSYTNYSNIWDEWRLLACEATYYPSAENAIMPSVTYSPIVGVLDRDNATALSTVTQAASYESYVMFSLTKKARQIYKMSGSAESQFGNVVTFSPAWFKYIGGGLSPTTMYGYIVVKGMFQFRGVVA